MHKMLLDHPQRTMPKRDQNAINFKAKDAGAKQYEKFIHLINFSYLGFGGSSSF